MKKHLSVLFSVLLVIFSGCADSSPKTSSSPEASTTSEAAAAEPTTTAASSPTTAAPITSAASDGAEDSIGQRPETSLFISDSGSDSASDSDLAESNPIAETAESLIGIPFAEGGASPSDGFDNSGFIYYVLRENGYVNCPRQIGKQIEWGENASIDDIKKGDILYFSDEPNGKASFGGVYVGGGEMIYSPSPGDSVKRADISTTYWQARFAAALSL